jgi:hypothetical protein
MTTSFPSRPVVAIDVPEVRNFNFQFVYNFFTPDERVNEEGSVDPSLIKKGSSNFDGGVIDRINNVPRFVRLTWTPVSLDSFGFEIGTEFSANLSARNDFIRVNRSKIYREEEFSNSGFTGMEFQDTGLDGKMYLLASGSLAKMLNSKNIQTSRAINEQLEFLADNIDTNKVSLLDSAKFLAGEISSEELPNQAIIDSLTDLASAGAKFYNNDQIQEKIDDTYERIKRVKTRIRFNNKVINTSLTTSATDPLGLFTDEIGPLLAQASEIQDEEISRAKPDDIQEAEFDIVVDPVYQRAAPKDSTFLPTRKHIGYIVDKYERADDGSLIEKSPIFIENKNTVSTFDFKIAYGATYIYQVRAIYLLEFQTFSDDSEDMVVSAIMVSSAASPRLVAECVETVPPPPPQDVDVIWDAVEQAPVVMWCFPVNTQRDIKKFQVFRRESIDEPFFLQIEYDFDDSVEPTDSPETTNINLIKNVSSPQNFWVDKGFKKDKAYIYTVCSIDAHGLTSNYGIQFEVKFDRFKNNIVKRLISNSGAPKPYPNMYLNADTFVDTIKDSNHSRMKLYFDPEYLSVIRQGSQEEPFIGTKQKNSMYKMQFINVDFQQSQVLDIIINDLRTTKNTSLFKSGLGKIETFKEYKKK